MASLNKFRSKYLLSNSHNKLHQLTLCTIIVFNMIYEQLPHLCTTHIQLSILYNKIPQSSSEFQTKIQPQRPGRFSNSSQRRAPVGGSVKIKKADIEYPFEHGEVFNCTLDGVSIQPVTTKIQVSFLSQLPERKEITQ